MAETAASIAASPPDAEGVASRAPRSVAFALKPALKPAPAVVSGSATTVWHIGTEGTRITVRDPAFAAGPFPRTVELPAGTPFNTIGILGVTGTTQWPEFRVRNIKGITPRLELTLLEPCMGYLYETPHIRATPTVVISGINDTATAEASVVVSVKCDAAFPTAHLPRSPAQVFCRFGPAAAAVASKDDARFTWPIDPDNVVPDGVANIRITRYPTVPVRSIVGIWGGAVHDYVVVEPSAKLVTVLRCGDVRAFGKDATDELCCTFGSGREDAANVLVYIGPSATPAVSILQHDQREDGIEEMYVSFHKSNWFGPPIYLMNVEAADFDRDCSLSSASFGGFDCAVIRPSGSGTITFKPCAKKLETSAFK